jgi:flavin-dependent dehydrogenase
MLAGELALAGADVAIAERRASHDLAGWRAAGLHSRTIEILDQRGIADRFLAYGRVVQVAHFSGIFLSVSDFPTRHPYVLGLLQQRFEQILAGWVGELGVHVYHGRAVTGFAQHDTGVDVELSDGPPLRARYLVGFTDVTRQAASYRDRRVLLAGDAAHVHFPLGGQGLNTGVQDAVNLGWKLAQVVSGSSPESLLDTYHAERHPVAARVLRNTMAQTALSSPGERAEALRDTMSELLSMDEPRQRIAAMMTGLDIRYDLGDGHPLLGRRMPDLDLATAGGPLRVYTLLHEGRPVLLNLGEPGALDITPWADRVQLTDANCAGPWELPVLGAITAPAAVLIRPDGYVAWVGDGTDMGLTGALSTWFGPPAAA